MGGALRRQVGKANDVAQEDGHALERFRLRHLAPFHLAQDLRSGTTLVYFCLCWESSIWKQHTPPRWHNSRLCNLALSGANPMYDLRIYNHHVGVVGSGIVFLKQKKKKNNASCYLLR
jgi:hypothetical protein